MEKVYHANANQKVGVTMLISGKVDFWIMNIITYSKDGYYIMVRSVSLLRKDITNSRCEWM